MKYQVKELALGAVLDQSIALVRDNLRLFLGIVGITIPFTLIFGLLQIQFATNGNLPALFLTLFASLIVALLLDAIVKAAGIHAVACVYLSHPTTIGKSFRHGFKRLLPMFGAFLLTTIASVGGLFLLVIPGIVFALWFSLSQQIAILESRSAVESLGRSRQLMKGNLLVMLALDFIEIAIVAGIASTSALIPQPHLQIAVQSIMQAITTILGIAIMVVFYYSCRCKAENYDLHLLANAISAADVRSAESGSAIPAE
jgi:hypothetical protein